MPFSTGGEFASRHNKKLHGHAADVAKATANSVLEKTGDEGKAIRIANAAGDKAMHKHKTREEKIKTMYHKKK